MFEHLSVHLFNAHALLIAFFLTVCLVTLDTDFSVCLRLIVI